MLFEILVGLAIVGVLTLTALFFAKGSRKQTGPSAGDSHSGLAPEERSHVGEYESGKPRNKANMDQPQEEFIEPEASRETSHSPK